MHYSPWEIGYFLIHVFDDCPVLSFSNCYVKHSLRAIEMSSIPIRFNTHWNEDFANHNGSDQNGFFTILLHLFASNNMKKYFLPFVLQLSVDRGMYWTGKTASKIRPNTMVS